MNIVPTRMELLKKKSQIKLAKKGHDLLRKKRDALILEFFKILKKARNLRKELNQRVREANRSVFYASLLSSSLDLEVLSGLNRSKLELEVTESNVMGVKIPKMSYSLSFSSNFPEFLATSQLYNVIRNYKHILKLVVEIAEIETSVKRILKEIEKTKRRVNALEYVVLPKLDKEVSYIKQRLDEIERDSFVSLKIIKRKLENERDKE